jgi:hypothetical protein
VFFMICLVAAAIAIARVTPKSESPVPLEQWPAGAI